MIDRQQADELASRYIANLGITVPIIVQWNSTLEKDWGWVYFYNATSESSPLAGNAPFIIERGAGRILNTGTAQALAHYIENYEFSGDPHIGPGSAIVLTGWREGAEKISATKIIQKLTTLQLSQAKSAIDGCLEDKQIVVETGSLECARQLVLELEGLGFSTKHLPAKPPQAHPTQNQFPPR